MIALLAQFAFGCFAVYGLWTATIQGILGAICWYGRRMNARQDREKVWRDEQEAIRLVIEDSKHWPKEAA